MAREKERVNQEDIINAAIQRGVQDGISRIIEEHPRLRSKDFSNYIDDGRLGEAVGKIYKELSEKKLPDEKKLEYLRETLAEYVADAGVFNEAGQKFISAIRGERKMNPLEKILRVVTFGALPKRKKDNLEQAYGAFQDIYPSFKYGDYAQRMPDLAVAAETIDRMGFLQTQIDYLMAHGQINEGKYESFKKEIRDRTKQAKEQFVGGIENYLTQQYQKAAAFILGIFGIIAILRSGKIITGGVIGSSNATSLGIAGIVLLFLSIILFFGFKKSKSKRVLNRRGKKKK